ncbi:putative RNA methyltransferase [Bacillus sp. SA1-12]|uniref:putative RNA methyltransferase n=1 Tax=Bacillus sp. SA1-12 TaxID=1455638 RepID=UPI000AB227C2|nr:methyltransferase domain-containing protein [Bacillus sp. SA1-12]
MLQENKRIKSANYVRNFEKIFACPICHASMKVSEQKSLICLNHHTFDFAKQGYINLTTSSGKTKYGKDLFEARRKLITECAFFEPLHHAITNALEKYIVKTKESISILDTGCGEGSHLSAICDFVCANLVERVIGVGIDISKEGIMIAAKSYTDKIWAVANLANTPFMNQQFDVILNILSPSNYAEFNRLLKPNGLVIKVVPQSGYLKELRHLFYKTDKQNYSNAAIVERFKERYQFVDHVRLTYTRSLNESSIKLLVNMTPLSWATTEEQVTSFVKANSMKITVDLDVLIGKH